MKKYNRLDDIPLDKVFQHNMNGFVSLIEITPYIGYLYPNASYLRDHRVLRMDWDCWELDSFEFVPDPYENYVGLEQLRLVGYDESTTTLEDRIKKSLEDDGMDSESSQIFQSYKCGFCTRTYDFHDHPTHLAMFGAIALELQNACNAFLKALEVVGVPILEIVRKFAESDAEDAGKERIGISIGISSDRMIKYVEILNKGLTKLYEKHDLKSIYPYIMDDDLSRYLNDHSNVSKKTITFLTLYRQIFQPIYKKFYEYILHTLNIIDFIKIMGKEERYTKFYKELKRRSPEPIIYGIGTCKDKKRLDAFVTVVEKILDESVNDETEKVQIIKNFARYFVILYNE